MIRIAVAPWLATLAALSFAACGGGDDGNGASTEEFIAKADAICQRADRKQVAVKGKKGGPYNNFSDARYLAKHNAVTQDALEQLKALEVPADQRKAVEAFLMAVEATVASVDKEIAALQTRDLPKQSQASREWQQSYGDTQASAGAVGLSRCQTLAN